MPDYQFNIYDIDPNTIFGGNGTRTVYSGPVTADGTATITDNATGAAGTGLDDDNATETATGTVTVGGATSTNVNVDAEISWTLRDTVTGETFQIVQLDVEGGDAGGFYLLSETPLIAGREYEVIDRNTLPDLNFGDATFSYDDYTDGVVEGTSGNDTIDSNYTGDPHGEMVDQSDFTTNVLSWSDLPNNTSFVDSSTTLNVGDIDVTLSVTDDGASVYAGDVAGTGFETPMYTASGELFDPNSSLFLYGDNDVNDDGIVDLGTQTMSVTLDFAASATSTNISDDVYNVSFRINDLDQADGAFTDVITITAIDGNGDPVTIILTPGANQTVNGTEVTGTGSVSAADAGGSLLVEIPGPVSEITIDYDNTGVNTQGVWISDIVFDSAYQDFDDTVEAGAGDDTIDAGLGSDTVSGGTGNDTILASAGDDALSGDAGDDTFVGIDGSDTVIGGETSETNGDTLDLSGETEAVNVTYTADEAGTATNSDGTVTFSEIENIITTDFNDTVDMPVDGGNADISTGAGDDTITISGDFAGSTHTDGGDGTDTLILTPDDGRDLNVDMTTGVTSDLLAGAQTFENIENLTTGAGDDTITTNGDINVIDSGAGDDTVLTSGGGDTLDGNAGTDTVSYENETSGVTLDLEPGATVVDSTGNTISNFENITGSDFDDTLSGSDGVNTISGGAGSDTIEGNGGGDTLDGGDGIDTLSYAGSDAAVTVDLSTNSATGGDATGDTVSNFENITGSAHDDTLTGDAGVNVIDGGAGDDLIDGGAGADTLLGGGGDDTFVGLDGNDTITGGETGETNGDTLDLSGETADLTVDFSAPEAGTATDGIDTLSFSEIENVATGSGDDTVTGGTGNENVDLGGGDDTFILQNSFGNDTVTGGETGETNGDTINASAVTTGLTVTATGAEAGTISDGSATLAFSEIEELTLTDQADVVDLSASSAGMTIDAGAGNDTLTGGTGADTLIAGDGDDTLYIGSGDSATGGDGNDTFIVDPSQLDGNALNIVGGETGDSGAGDTLDLSSLGGLFIPGSIVYDSGDPESGSLTLADGTVVTFSGIETVICFAGNTRIATPYGPRRVEDLKPGDLILTKDNGPQPLRWVGARIVPARGRFAPIEIDKGALGNSEKLIVSPQHRMLLEGWRAEMLFGASEVFAAAKHLVNDSTIRQVEGELVTYYHLMFDQHEIIFAEDTPSESFHVSDLSLTGVRDEAREELFTLFPELRALPGSHGPTARKCLKAHEASMLIAS